MRVSLKVETSQKFELDLQHQSWWRRQTARVDPNPDVVDVSRAALVSMPRPVNDVLFCHPETVASVRRRDHRPSGARMRNRDPTHPKMRLPAPG
jgi:hypothetical protein